MTKRNFRLGVALVVALALLARLIYHLGTEPLVHIAGDINDYVRYAWNLGQHGVYSSAPVNPDIVPEPDSFRPPGFPVFLLLAMWLADFAPDWNRIAYSLQILLSSATVLITVLLGREWMKPAYALGAGVLLALWPHHIVFASTLLSETLLGFCVILALWLATIAQRKASLTLAVAAGLVFGYAALVNSLMLLFPFLVAAAMLGLRNQKHALVLVAAFLVLPASWAMFGPDGDGGTHNNTHRATMNFVQGSWPHYHQAWRARDHHESAREIMRSIGTEVTLVNQDPRAGLEAIVERISLDPASYARWYMLEKPYLLWGWDIQLGWGGVHFLPVKTTPLERHPLFRTAQTVLKALNPVIFILAGLAAIGYALAWTRARRPPFGALLVALFTLYVTGLHVVLQAEPRYSIPYRPEQLLLALGMLAVMVTKASQLLSERRNLAEGPAPKLDSEAKEESGT